MLAASVDVLILNILVMYTWSAVGVTFFGGRLTQEAGDLGHLVKHDSPAMDYNGSNLVFNFNDVPSAVIMMFCVTLNQWMNANIVATLAIFGTTWPAYFAVLFFWVSYFVSSVLVAFNVFVAFAIDAYCVMIDP